MIDCINEGELYAPVTASITADDAKMICGFEDVDNVTQAFKGDFIPLSMAGETIQEKLNSGLEELIERGILWEKNVTFWK